MHFILGFDLNLGKGCMVHTFDFVENPKSTDLFPFCYTNICMIAKTGLTFLAFESTAQSHSSVERHKVISSNQVF